MSFRIAIGGMIAAAEALGAAIIPTFYAEATPSGVIDAGTYDSMLRELLAGIKAALPLDAVALSLHGAGMVEGIDDREGHLCQAVRTLVGTGVKIVLSLDLHGRASRLSLGCTITHTRTSSSEGMRRSCSFPVCSVDEAATAAHRAGIGSTLRISLGGKYGPSSGGPLTVTAYVKSLTYGKFVLQDIAQGTRVDLGRMARLQIEGIDVLVASERHQTLDPEVFLLHGINVMRYKIIALKSSQHFWAGFQAIARAIITADSPGLRSALRPMDMDASYSS